MSIDETIDRLYALPPEEFTQARNQAERELRKTGEREAADQVKALRKPTAGAAAVNSLVRSHRGKVEAFLKTAAKLRDAQFAGRGDLGAAAQAERVALEELVALGGESVRATLEAAAVDDGVAQDLLATRFVREPEPVGFGTLLAHADPATARSTTAKPKSGRTGRKTKPDDSAARTRLRGAKKALEAAAAEERQPQRRWTETQRELEAALAALENAHRELDRLREN